MPRKRELYCLYDIITPMVQKTIMNTAPNVMPLNRRGVPYYNACVLDILVELEKNGIIVIQTPTVVV